MFGQGFAPIKIQPHTIILDTRTPEEFEAGHVKGAQNIDLFASDLLEQINKLDKDKDYLLYCRSGNRSGQMTAMMKQLGFKSVANIGGLGEVSQMEMVTGK